MNICQSQENLTIQALGHGTQRCCTRPVTVFEAMPAEALLRVLVV